MIKIRQASKDDAEILALLGRITYKESHGHFINNNTDLRAYNDTFFSVKKIKQDLADKNNIFHLIYVSHLPVGYSKLILNFPNKNITSTNVCKLERIYILNDFIAQKIGLQLMNTVLKTATKLHFSAFWLSVYKENKRALNFYKKNGFKIIGSISFMVGNKDFPNYVLSKKL